MKKELIIGMAFSAAIILWENLLIHFFPYFYKCLIISNPIAAIIRWSAFFVLKKLMCSYLMAQKI